MFNFSKPISLLQKLFEQFCPPNEIVLDSFAGSGTTAHAVLNLNKIDGGKRKFILIEMEDYANDITAERIKRVTQGYGSGKKEMEGTGGSFDYYKLGLPLFDENHNLNEEVATEKIIEYIWYSETRSSFEQSETRENKYYLGEKEGTAYYFIYEKEELTELNYEALSQIKTRAEQYIIYADNCILPKDFMSKHHIIFKKIPRDITRF